MGRAEEPAVKAGAVVTCEAGHRVCEVVKDIYFGDMDWSKHFGKWDSRQRKPVAGDMKIKCFCGELWFDGTYDLAKRGPIHFSDGWHW